MPCCHTGLCLRVPPLMKTSYSNPLWLALLLGVTLIIALPTLSVWAAWWRWDASQQSLMQHLWATVMPSYTWTSLLLCIGVALGVAGLGLMSAVLVTMFDFPGRQTLAWLLLLPMAMPAYVVAYAYTDFFQYSGPLQVALREWTGRTGALLPDIRSLGGAVLVFSVTLYPYVYLLVRTALLDRASSALEAAKLLGAGLGRRIWTIAIPMARPALAAGLALALMETLADFGVASYFGVQSFTAGIYKAWLVMDDPMAAAQLATLLLVCVLVLLIWDHRAQQRLRYASSRGNRSSQENQPRVCTGAAGLGLLALGSVPVVLGFVLPSAVLIHLWLTSSEPTPWASYGLWAWNTLELGAITAVLAVGLSLAFLATQRLRNQWLIHGLTRIISAGYAIPGAVVVIGILAPLRWFQSVEWIGDVSYWITSTSLGLIWAYLIRFCAVAMQSLQSGYSRVPASIDEASRTLGASDWRLFGGVHLPLLQRSVWVAGLLVLVDVMKELPATLVLRPFDADTLAVVAYQLARDERLGEAALPSLTLVLIGLLPVIWVSRTLRAKPQS